MTVIPRSDPQQLHPNYAPDYSSRLRVVYSVQAILGVIFYSPIRLKNLLNGVSPAPLVAVLEILLIYSIGIDKLIV